MTEFRDPAIVHAVLSDPSFVVPPVPPGDHGIAWLRASVGRFSTGADHVRRRGLSESLLAAIPIESLTGHAADQVESLAGIAAHEGELPSDDVTRRGESSDVQPVVVLARALGISAPVLDLVRDVAQAYQPGTGDPSRADAAVEQLVSMLGRSELSAARIGLLVQARDATDALAARLRSRPLEDVLRDDPPVRLTKRLATVATTLGGVPVAAGEIVRLALAGDLAFGAGPRRCPGRDHAIALAVALATEHSVTISATP